MNDFRSSFLKSRLAKLPPLPDLAQDDQGTSQPPPPPPPNRISGDRLRGRKGLYSPLKAEGCFEQALEVKVQDRHQPIPGLEPGDHEDEDEELVFRAYYTPPRSRSKPTLPKTGGEIPTLSSSMDGGTSQSASIVIPSDALELNLSSGDLGEVDDDDGEDTDEETHDAGTLFVLHHGAGYSGLSYALVAKEITRLTEGQVGVLAMDCRGHGKTYSSDNKTSDLSLSTLTRDLISLLITMFPSNNSMPKLVLVGHSMGGAVVASACHVITHSGLAKVAGIAVLDVVEGTAIQALPAMKAIVQSQPQGFESVEEAIRWHIDSKTINNLESARISVPPLLVPNPNFDKARRDEGEEGGEEAWKEEMEELRDYDDEQSPTTNSVEGASVQAAKLDSEAKPLIWRTDLLSSEPFWQGWFKDLSSRFLSARTARLLVLAGADRLDRELMIGQMQGKYQMVVIPDVGHCLQEDAPERTAKILVDFWRRNDSISIGGIKKVGEF
ncbi:protein phosphatase methylesterase [Violaceomyces palustris]|uniref:Protein phosphatase methylesterase n=1 Tax=Violaceomyces palustris TaxID=1673888 RepID=A0ACD0NUD8_9BASI|nr:protein phosphatase methylesterase [Violaceomyces palustris]